MKPRKPAQSAPITAEQPSNDVSTAEAPTYWRTLAELDRDPQFQEFVEREFRSPLENKPLSSPGRRRFMQLMGASFALAGCRWEKEKILPHSRRPDGKIPGVPVDYATVMDIAGVATSLWVKSFDGRPIKVEGNPGDATSLGATSTFHQASVLGLYDPDRSRIPVRFRGSRTPSNWSEANKALREVMTEAKQNGGGGFAVLSEASSSPTLRALKDRLEKALPGAKWVVYEPTHPAGEVQGSELAFGQRVRSVYSADKADVIVSLDSDFLCATSPGGIANSRAVASRRDPDAGSMSRIYTVESSFTEVGAIADHRISLRAAQVAAVAAYLDSQISPKANPLPELGAAQPVPDAAFLKDAATKQVLDVMVQDLLTHPGKSLVVTGSHQPAEVHALVHRLNALLGNVGQTVSYLEDGDRLLGGVDGLTGLVADMDAGKVDTLLILGGNPVYNAPVDVPFGTALAKVRTSVHLSEYEDETAQLCSWHLPQAHYLETWGDAVGFDGLVRIAQPLLAPLHDGKSTIELLAELLGEPGTEGQDLVRATHRLKDDAEWRRAVHDGRVDSKASEATPSLRPLAKLQLSEAALGTAEVANGKLEVVFSFDPKVHDGRYANNGWLQELPHPLSKLCWGNAALISPSTAEKLGVGDGHLITITLEGRKVTLPALQTPGQAPGSIGLALGYGRKFAGVVGGSTKAEVEIVGSNTYAIRTSKALAFATGASVEVAGGRQELALVQDLHAIDAIGQHGRDAREGQLIRETTIDEYKKHPDVIAHKVHHPPLLNLWTSPVSYEGRKWGMAIDLNKCTGCSACIVACQAENNTPVVGKTEVAMGREMSWLRVERYYKGDRNQPAVRQQPVLCQQCENAPCEQVCPVGATMHSSEGLNDMVYNRCIGTRYCSNNCPYKVRRFNYRNYNLQFYGTTPYTGTDDPKAKLKAMVLNPEVTVRSRGVMEKCTFCVQRIQNTKIKANNAKRPIEDGEIKTACEQSCPAGAIVFGDLNDKNSRVAKAHTLPRAYELLAELNNRPRVNYLARISNPHPELMSQDGHSERH